MMAEGRIIFQSVVSERYRADMWSNRFEDKLSLRLKVQTLANIMNQIVNHVGMEVNAEVLIAEEFF